MRAQSIGYTVVDINVVISTHFTEVLRNHADEVFTRAQLTEYLERVSARTPKLVEELIPSLISAQGLFKVLRNLLKEGISIRDSHTILEAISEYSHKVKDMDMLTEFVRQNLSRHITHRYMNDQGQIECISFAPDVQQIIDRHRRRIKIPVQSSQLANRCPAKNHARYSSGCRTISQAHILCPHFTRGTFIEWQKGVLNDHLYLSAKETNLVSI